MITAWSNQPPPRYEIIHSVGDEMCDVLLYTSVHTHLMSDGDTAYSSVVLQLNVAYSDDLLEDLRNNYSEWLEMAHSDDERK